MDNVLASRAIGLYGTAPSPLFQAEGEAPNGSILRELAELKSQIDFQLRLIERANGILLSILNPEVPTASLNMQKAPNEVVRTGSQLATVLIELRSKAALCNENLSFILERVDI